MRGPFSEVLVVYWISFWPRAPEKKMDVPWVSCESTPVDLLQTFLLAVRGCLLWWGAFEERPRAQRAMIYMDLVNLWQPSVHHNICSGFGSREVWYIGQLFLFHSLFLNKWPGGWNLNVSTFTAQGCALSKDHFMRRGHARPRWWNNCWTDSAAFQGMCIFNL